MSAFNDLDSGEVTESVVARLRRLVELESPSSDEARLRTLGKELERELTAAGADVSTVDAPGVGEMVVGRVPGADGAADLEPILVLTHMDTVHPVGTFDPLFRLEDGRVHGPGTFDMKGGIACVLEALHRLHQAGERPRRPVTVLITCDEETGSHASRELIVKHARQSRAVLVPEPAMPDGGVKTRRKGVGVYRLDVQGEATHAGLAPEQGINAVVELAHQVLALQELSDAREQCSVTVCQTGGGVASNVVPPTAWATVDIRFPEQVEGERIDRAIRALRPQLEGARLRISGGINRPPLERSDGVVELYQRARDLAAEADWELPEGASGGGSDGSITAALGVPTLDGLGPVGDGAHASHEHVRLDDLPRRVRLLGRLFETL